MRSPSLTCHCPLPRRNRGVQLIGANRAAPFCHLTPVLEPFRF